MNRDDDIIELGPDQDGAPGTPEPTYGPYDPDHPPPLDFEAWAGTSAALLERDEAQRQSLLQSRELEAGLWDACNDFWSLALAQQMGAGDFGLATRYGMLCRAELLGRTADPTAQQPTAQQPTAQQSSAQEAVSPDAAGSVDATAFLTRLPMEATLPFEQPALQSPASPPAQPAAADEPPREHPVERSEQTAFVPALEVGDALPFKDDGDASKD